MCFISIEISGYILAVCEKNGMKTFLLCIHFNKEEP